MDMHIFWALYARSSRDAFENQGPIDNVYEELCILKSCD